MSVGRNDPCPCGSGKKYKKCCLPKEAAQARQTVLHQAPEEHFIAEMRPDLDEAVDRLLERLERGEGKRVETELKALYEKHPRYHMVNYAMGVYAGMIEQDLDSAIEFFEAAVHIFPLLPQAHYNLGSSHFKTGHVREAVEAF